MEVYAAYLAYTDHEIGRVIQAVEDMGKLDNTLIIYISGDNGGSAEGSPVGTPNEMTFFNGVEVPVEVQLKNFYDVWGSQFTYPHMAVGWTWAIGSRRNSAGPKPWPGAPISGRPATSSLPARSAPQRLPLSAQPGSCARAGVSW